MLMKIDRQTDNIEYCIDLQYIIYRYNKIEYHVINFRIVSILPMHVVLEGEKTNRPKTNYFCFYSVKNAKKPCK